MGESDAAGPRDAGEPKKRALTTREAILAAVEREWAALTPEERAQRKVEAEKADREAFEEARRAMRPTLKVFESSTESARRFAAALEAAAMRPAPWALAQPPVLDPNKSGEALREILSQIEPAHRPANPEEIRAAVADAVKATLAESKKDQKPRGETTCERFRDLHVNVDPEFAETAPERLLGERIERKPGTFPYSHYWRTVLRPRRAKVRAEIREAKRKLREARRYGHFDSVGRANEDSEAH